MKNSAATISSKSVSKLLLIIAVTLILASISGQAVKFISGHAQLFGLIDLFNLDYERNIPTLFSTLLLAVCSALLAIIFHFHRMQKTPQHFYWAVLSLGFIYLAIDEFVELHENLNNFTALLIGNYSHGILHFSWVIPATILIILLVIFFWKFLFNLPKTTRIQFILAGSIYLAGAIGMELPGAYYEELYGQENLTYSLITTVEESLEMLGLILFIRALLDYLSKHFPIHTIQFLP